MLCVLFYLCRDEKIFIIAQKLNIMKQILSLIPLLLLFCNGLFAQSLVTTEPTQKNALIEEFTGFRCQNCPEGHREAQVIHDNNPGRAFVIAIHQGYYSGGTPNYTTPFGDALANQAGVNSWPSGTVNRHVFAGTNTAMGVYNWVGPCNTIMQEMSPVNIGATSAYNASNRTLTINVELYYTANAPASNNFINVALIQDSIYGPQTGGIPSENYLHMHMLRHLITGQWGDEVTTTTQGTMVSRTYTYVVPTHYNNVPTIVSNMKVVAFVAEGHQEIYTATEIDAIDGGTIITGSMTTTDLLIKKGANATETTFTLEAKSTMEGTTAFEFNLETVNNPADWQIGYMIDGVEYSGTATVDLTKNTPRQVLIKVTPSATAGFPEVTLKMKSLVDPAGAEVEVKVSVISGVTDLIVNGTGGNATTTHQGVYTDALEASGISSFAVTNANTMTDLVNANVFGGVFTFWLNISWTTPAITQQQATALKTYMNAGNSVFIAGQNIAWDIMSGESGSHGNLTNKNIFTNYLKAIYVNNGSASTSKLSAASEDPIFGDVGMSNLVTSLGSNNYPDEIKAGAGANIIFNYDSPSQHAAVRYDNIGKFRSIYFAIGLEMLANTQVRNQIVSLSREWLSEGMVSVEYDAAMNTLLSGQNYPNPASDYTFINVNEAAKGGIVQIYNLNGQLMASQPIGSTVPVRIDLSNLNEGMYVYRIVSGNTTSEARKLTVIR